jgi:DNA polymerase III subunit delta
MPSALEFLSHPEKFPSEPVCVLFGSELFLQREALAHLRGTILPGDDAEFSCTVLSGESATGYKLEWATVNDELSTVALFGGGQRLVIVERADDFVSSCRAQLEDYVAKPCRTGTLILVVKTWPSNTKLYKAVAASGLNVECKPLTEAELLRWMSRQAEKKHGAKIDSDAAELLWEIVGDEMGRLDQELEKLALIARTPASGTTAADKGLPTITRELVEEAVGGWRAKTAWDLSEQMNSGNAAAALLQLQRLYDSGEDPIPLLAMISSSLRKYAAATRLADLAQAENRRADLKSLLTEVGIKTWPAAMQAAESHIKQIARPRGRKILSWLLDIDLALKGRNSSGHKARLMLEELVVKLSKQTAAL